MKVICCSCRIFLRNTPSEVFDDDDISHGLCETCAHHFIAQMGMSLQEYLEGIPIPVLVVAQEGTINSANSSAMKLLGKPPASIQGSKGGEVFECEHSRLPAGCGETIHCSGCTIRNTVMDTMETGTPHSKVRAYLNRDTIDGSEHTNLLISTEKKGEIVFLKIEEMNIAS